MEEINLHPADYIETENVESIKVEMNPVLDLDVLLKEHNDEISLVTNAVVKSVCSLMFLLMIDKCRMDSYTKKIYMPSMKKVNIETQLIGMMLVEQELGFWIWSAVISDESISIDKSRFKLFTFKNRENIRKVFNEYIIPKVRSRIELLISRKFEKMIAAGIAIESSYIDIFNNTPVIDYLEFIQEQVRMNLFVDGNLIPLDDVEKHCNGDDYEFIMERGEFIKIKNDQAGIYPIYANINIIRNPISRYVAEITSSLFYDLENDTDIPEQFDVDWKQNGIETVPFIVKSSKYNEITKIKILDLKK